jgi:transcriptional regulator with XRE-family HTH domain
MVPRERTRTYDGLQDSAALPSAGEPGDLGKRVSRRRQDLKLSRRQLAGLAGVSVPYAMGGRTVIFQTAPDTLLAGYLDCLARSEADGLNEALQRQHRTWISGTRIAQQCRTRRSQS